MNQKQVARKLLNVRQSSRFSPASTNYSGKTAANLNRKLSASNLINQFGANSQNENLKFFEK